MSCSINSSLKICIEIPMLLTFFALALGEIVIKNLFVYRVCYVTLEYDETKCSLLGTGNKSEEIKDLERQVQPYALMIIMTRTLIEAIIPAFLNLFLGPWSDRYGRKPLLLSCIGGYLSTFVIWTVLSSQPYVSPWWFILGSVTESVCGGMCTFTTILFCYVSDITTQNKRTIRMGTIEVTIAFGLFLGNIVGAHLFKLSGYTAVFSVSSIFLLTALLYTWSIIDESLIETQQSDRITQVLNFQLIVDNVKVCFRKRNNADRAILWTAMAILILRVLAAFGGSGVEFLYFREKFNWSIQRYATFYSIENPIKMCGTLFGVYVLNKMMNVSEPCLGMLAIMETTVTNIIKTFSQTDWQLYSVIPIMIFGNLVAPMCRSIISKTAPPEDLGKFFSLSSCVESFTSLLASPAYTFLYNATLKTFPGAFNLVSAAVCVLIFFLMLTIAVLQKKYIVMDSTQVLVNEE